MVPQCVSCIATGKLFVCIGKKKLFFVFFFETADRYTTGPLLDSEKYVFSWLEQRASGVTAGSTYK